VISADWLGPTPDPNSIALSGDNGIELTPQGSASGAGSIWNLVVINNTISGPAGIGIFIDADSSNSNYTLNLDLEANAVTGNTADFAYQVMQGNGGSVNLEQGASSSTNPEQVIMDNNSGEPVIVSGVISVQVNAVDNGLIPASLGDFVWSDLNRNGVQNAGEHGVAGVSIALAGTPTAGGSVNLSTTTDSIGVYLFPAVLPGTYTLTVMPPAGFSFAPPLQGSNPALDSDFDLFTGQAGVILSTDNLDVDAGLVPADVCTGDLEPAEGDGDVDGADLAVFAADFGRTDCPPSGGPTGIQVYDSSDPRQYLGILLDMGLGRSVPAGSNPHCKTNSVKIFIPGLNIYAAIWEGSGNINCGDAVQFENLNPNVA